MKHEERMAHATFLERQLSTVALTLVWNEWPVSIYRIKRDLRSLHARVDRAIIGPRYHKKPETERSQLWAVVELLDRYGHIHAGWALSEKGVQVLDFELQNGIWQRLAPRGGFNLQLYTVGWAGYATKALNDSSQIIFSSEFLRG